MTERGGRNFCQIWLGLAVDTWMLGAEATLVVPLRLARMARGGAAAKAEARRMVSEKVIASRRLLRQIASGQHGYRPDEIAAASAQFYLARVRANRRRLARRMIG